MSPNLTAIEILFLAALAWSAVCLILGIAAVVMEWLDRDADSSEMTHE